MGGVSALIVSPCVAAPLAGALVYSARRATSALGGTALFSLAAGMSVPLLLVGASAGALLPRAGAWMVESRPRSACCCSAWRIWIVQPVLPAPLVLGAWGLLAARRAAVMLRAVRRAQPARAARRRAWLARRSASLLGLVGALQIVGAASGGSDPLQPLAHLRRAAASTRRPAMPRFQTRAQRRRARRRARSARPPGDARLLRRLVRLVQGDGALHVHRPGGADEARRRAAAEGRRHRQQCATTARCSSAFGLFGPPGTIFFDAAGAARSPARA